LCQLESPIRGQLRIFIAVPRLDVSHVLLGWKIVKLPKAVMKRDSNVMGCIFSIPAKVNERSNVLVRAKELECDRHFHLPDGKKNENDEFSEGFWLMAACNYWCARKALLERRKEENLMSYLLYSALSFSFLVKITRDLEARMLRAWHDGLEVAQGCLWFRVCIEGDRRLCFVSVIWRMYMPPFGPKSLCLNFAVNMDCRSPVNGNVCYDGTSVFVCSVSGDCLICWIGKGGIDLTRGPGPPAAVMLDVFRKSSRPPGLIGKIGIIFWSSTLKTVILRISQRFSIVEAARCTSLEPSFRQTGNGWP
jgi:hypothetical protein